MQRNRDPCTMLVECKMLTDTVENSLMATWKVKHGTTHCFKMLLRPYGQWLMPPHPQAWQKATPRVASKTYQQTSRHFTAKMTPFSTSAQCSKSDSCLQELSRTNQLHTHSSIAQLCPTLCDPIVHGILQARTLEWVALPFSRESSQPRDQAQVSHIVGRFFTSWATRKAQKYWCILSSLKNRQTAPTLHGPA